MVSSAFGLTPAARGNVTVAPGPRKPNPFDEFDNNPYTKLGTNPFDNLKSTKLAQPLEIDVRREVREIMRTAPSNHLAVCSSEFIRETAFLIAKMHANKWHIGHRDTMKMLRNLNLLGMSPLGRAQGPRPERSGGGGSGGDAA